MTQAPLLVLVACPYRSGTNGEQSLIDANLRIPGQSAGAYMGIQVASAHGLRIYYSLDDLPQL